MELMESNISENNIVINYIDINDSEDVKREKEEAFKKLNAFLEKGRKSFAEGRVVSSEQLKREFPFVSELNL